MAGKEKEIDALTIGLIIRETREKKGLTQEELARRSGIAQTTLSDIENGKIMIKNKSLMRILSAINGKKYSINYGKITEIRKHKNITLKELSKMTGLSTSVINKIENGHSNSYIGTLIRIAQALEVHVREFIKVEDKHG